MPLTSRNYKLRRLPTRSKSRVILNLETCYNLFESRRTRFAQMGSEIRSNENISNLCEICFRLLETFKKRNFEKISSKLGLPMRKVGVSNFRLRKRWLQRTQNVYYGANYIGTMPTILCPVNEWDLDISSCLLWRGQGRCCLSPNRLYI